MNPSGAKPRVVVTRARTQSSALADHLRALGAEPVLLPLIAVSPPDSFVALDRALAGLRSFDWLVVTSSNAVRAVASRASELGVVLARDASVLRIAAIGEATARALVEHGLSCDLVAPEPVSESLAAALVPFACSNGERAARFLLPRAQDARDVLPETLTRAGAEVAVAAAYRKALPPQALGDVHDLFAGRQPPPEAIAFTSSSTVRNLFALLDEAGLRLPYSVLRVSIGPITSATLRELGYPPDVEAPTASVASLASATISGLRLHET